ncbi:MAG: type II/IV secretion system protein [Candidatus Pacebacteria bacterium]|nr:type II/IV secretion system protein [Candidatus Paceibacterota bacterium]
MILLNLLTSQNVLSGLEVKAIEEEAKTSPVPIDEILSEHNVPEVAILTARNAIYGIPVFNGDRDLADPGLYNMIDKDKAERYLTVPLGMRSMSDEKDKKIITSSESNKGKNDFIKNKDINDEVLIGVVDPERKNVLDAIQFLLTSAGVSYKIYLISLSEFKRRFEGYARSGESASPQYTHKREEGQEIKDELMDITDEDENIPESLVDSMPMSKIINIAVKSAIVNVASDIHIENMGDRVRIRYRVDGVLITQFNIPIARASAVVARIKVLSGMKLDEKRKPQDGRFSVKYEGHKIDFRVSTFPTYYGEKVVIRILDSYRGVKKLEDIGLSKVHLAQIRSSLEKPYGIVLISGPTGSGKTTTLYSMLNELDREKKNVVSLEDPVEYNIPSMNQSQVFPEIGYTFATGLRSILRQDPDIIMVGEIRDAETAQLAIQAALTGHLVFSTIHTNNSIGVITRLLDMGVDPFLIAPTLILAIAQRLVRKIDADCAQEIDEPGVKAIIDDSFKTLADEYKKDLPLDKNPKNAVPSSSNPSGLKGRMPVIEILEVDHEIQNLILGRKPEDDIWQVARKKGMISMREDAIIKSLEGIVPFTEVDSL